MFSLDRTAKWPDSQEPTHTVYATQFAQCRLWLALSRVSTWKIGPSTQCFEELGTFSWCAERSACAISFQSISKGDNVSHLLDGYQWAEINTCTIVEVGGSRISEKIS